MKKYVHTSHSPLLFYFAPKGSDQELIYAIYSPDVEFCGYSIPHPSESKLNIRIQTYGTSIHIYPFPHPQVPYKPHHAPHPQKTNPSSPHASDNASVYAVMDKALNDLEAMCDVVLEKFTDAVKEKEKSKGESGNEVEMKDA